MKRWTAPTLPRRPMVRALLILLAATAAPPAAAQEPVPESGVDLPVVEHVLENGMRFLILPREGAPTVSFVMRYPVGSLHESAGYTGIAHMLEHMLFKGTATVGTRDPEGERAWFPRIDAVADSLRIARASADPARIASIQARLAELEDSARAFVVPNEFDRILTRHGARDLNAMTEVEATTYHVQLPANRAKLWFMLEAERMSEPVFREFHTERDVVAEERRMRIETSPDGLLHQALLAEAYRVHPYGVPVIGRMDDILGYTRGQVEEYHRRYYGPNNAVVAVVGAVEPDSIVAWAEAYFGGIKRGEDPPPVLAREPEQTEERRVVVHFDAEPRLLMGWHVVEAADPDAPALVMLAAVLAGGQTGRLYRRLVVEEGLAHGVWASRLPGGSHPQLFTIGATPAPPHTTADVERAVLEEIARLQETPPAPEELARVRNQLEAGEVRRLQSAFALAFQLAESATTHGDWRETFRFFERLSAVEPEDVSRVARRYFHDANRTVAELRRSDGAVEPSVAEPRRLDGAAEPQMVEPRRSDGVAEPPVAARDAARTAEPRPDALRSPSAGPRSSRPPIGRPAVEAAVFEPLRFEPPEPEMLTLSNGVTVFYLEDRSLPLVSVLADFAGGPLHFGREDFAAAQALGSLILTGGTATLPPDSLAELLESYALAPSFVTGGSRTTAGINTLSRNLDVALEIWSEMLGAPRFDPDRVELWRRRELDRARRAQDDPGAIAIRAFNRLMFGDHPIGWTLDEADLEPDRLTEERLRRVHGEIFCPDRMTLGVTGDVGREEVVRKLEAVFAEWAPCPSELGTIEPPRVREVPGVVLVHRELEQSTVIVGQAGGVTRAETDDFLASQLGNWILGGGGFSSRLMARLRTERGLAYNAWSVWGAGARHERLFGLFTQTRAESTGDALTELRAVVESMREEAPSEDELRTAVDNIVNGYVFAFENPAEIVARRMSHHADGLPEDWLRDYIAGIQRLPPEAVHDVFRRHIQPDSMSIVIVGDTTRFRLPSDLEARIIP